MNTKNNEKKLIAVIGATGQQGGGVVRALQASGQFKVRALSRDPGKHSDLADEVVEADLNRPETLPEPRGCFWAPKTTGRLVRLVCPSRS
jgi:nucleoside-diphosphate-sugar epimerase